MRILFIEPYAGSTRYGPTWRCFNFARDWVQQGHRVTLVGASFTHLRTTNPSTSGWRVAGTEDGVQQIWLRTPKYKGNGLGRVINMLAFGAQLKWRARAIASELSPEAVIVSCPHPFGFWGGQEIARASGCPWIFEVRDIWPLSLIEIAGTPPSHPFIRWMQRTEDRIYASADGLASPLRGAEAHCRARGWKGDFCWVPNAAPRETPAQPAEPLPLAHQAAIDRVRRSAKFLLGYAGMIGKSQGLDVILAVAERLPPQQFAFLMLGAGTEAERLRLATEARAITNVHWLPRVAQSAVPTFLSQMDALVCSLAAKPLFQFGTSMNKAVNYMMSGRPVISATPDKADAIARSGCGLNIPAEDAPAMIEAILQLAAIGASGRAEMGARGPRYLAAELNLSAISQRYLTYLQKVAARHHAPKSAANTGVQLDVTAEA